MSQKRSAKRHPVTQPSDPSYRFIPLTKRQNAIVDAEDYDWLNQWNWCATWQKNSNTFHAARRIGHKGQLVKMHNVIIGVCPPQQVDHIDHNGLNNRRKNLRKCTNSQNMANRRTQSNNTSGYKGVSWNKRMQKWRVRIFANGREFCGGYYTQIEDAARAADKIAIIHHGKFAFLNFPH